MNLHTRAPITPVSAATSSKSMLTIVMLPKLQGMLLDRFMVNKALSPRGMQPYSGLSSAKPGLDPALRLAQNSRPG
jgi:hypothetical protein